MLNISDIPYREPKIVGLELSLSDPELVISTSSVAFVVTGSFLTPPFASEANNCEVPGSELDTDDVPASVAEDGVPISRLLMGVTAIPWMDLEEPWFALSLFQVIRLPQEVMDSKLGALNPVILSDLIGEP